MAKRDPLQILSNARRRALIRVLRELGGTASLREVVRRIAEREQGGDFDRKLLKSVHVSLVQSHIPKMETYGLIEYDRVMDTVSLLELPPEYLHYLEFDERDGIPWSLLYLVVSVVGLGLGIYYNNLLALIISSCFTVASGAQIFRALV